MNANEILSAISSVIGVLNNVEVKGKQNLANLHGAISILEDVYGKIIRPEKPDTERHDDAYGAEDQ